MLINCVAYRQGQRLSDFELDELAVEDVRHGQQQPKIEAYGDTLFAVINTIERLAALGLIGATCGVLYWRFRRAGWL